MAHRRVVVSVSTEEHAELVARAGGREKLPEYARRRLLGEPAAALAERYGMALEAIRAVDDTYSNQAMTSMQQIAGKALER